MMTTVRTYQVWIWGQISARYTFSQYLSVSGFLTVSSSGLFFFYPSGLSSIWNKSQIEISVIVCLSDFIKF
jgi:hypothetical protein